MNIKLPYRDTFRIRSYEADMMNNVKISSIFNFMQETASVNAAQLGFGFEDLASEGYIWVLSRAKIIMNHYPKAFEEIIVETWPKNIVKLFAYRDFRFYDSQNNIIGSATTAWLMINKNNLRPVNPEILLKSINYEEIKPGIDEILDKIIESENKEFAAEYLTGYKDLDINLHTNNSRYIEYLSDCLESEFVSGKLIKSFQINFLNQTKSGDIIRVFRSPILDNHLVYSEAENMNGQKIFNALIEWA